MNNSTKVLLGAVLALGLPFAAIHASDPPDRRPTEVVPSQEERLQWTIDHGAAAEREAARAALEELRKRPRPEERPAEERPAYAAGLIVAAICLAVGVGLFLVLRTFVLWYWKIDKIERHLAQLVAHFTGKLPPE